MRKRIFAKRTQVALTKSNRMSRGATADFLNIFRGYCPNCVTVSRLQKAFARRLRQKPVYNSAPIGYLNHSFWPASGRKT